MGISKTSEFSNSQNKKALLFKALGHPARVAIIEHLISVKTCICNDLVGILPLSQATISQHLKALKDSGIIRGTIDRNSLCYCINADILIEIIHFLEIYLEESKGNKNICC